jgi:glycosyltransferase involved in cell wall biosynthesis
LRLKILILAKRKYTGKDLLDDRYGRIFELSKNLAKQGNHIQGIALSYHQPRDNTLINERYNQGSLSWRGIGTGWTKLAGLNRYFRIVAEVIRQFQPDILLSASDCFHIIWGERIAGRFRLPHVVDLYDNFESYGASRLPGIIPLFRRAVSRADGIVCVSDTLKGYIIETCRPKADPLVVTNATDSALFLPQDQAACRRTLGLPRERVLVGTGGALEPGRGVDHLFAAFQVIAAEDPTIDLVLSGPVANRTSLPTGDRIYYLGELPYQQMPLFYNALNIGVICNLDSAFGRYCFPQKFHEMIACGLPVAASAVGVMPDLMASCPGALFTPGDTSSLINAIRYQAQQSCLPQVASCDWEDQGEILNDFLQRLLRLN